MQAQATQAVELPALPQVEEVSLHDVEAELLSSSRFCDIAWIVFASADTEQAAALAA